MSYDPTLTLPERGPRERPRGLRKCGNVTTPTAVYKEQTFDSRYWSETLETQASRGGPVEPRTTSEGWRSSTVAAEPRLGDPAQQQRGRAAAQLERRLLDDGDRRARPSPSTGRRRSRRATCPAARRGPGARSTCQACSARRLFAAKIAVGRLALDAARRSARRRRARGTAMRTTSRSSSVDAGGRRGRAR